MSEVKRYEEVHLRYDDNNIRYGQGCEVEVVTASDYDRETQECIAAGIRMQEQRDAALAECEWLRGLLQQVRVAVNLDDTEYGLGKGEKADLVAKINSALSAKPNNDGGVE